VKKVCLTGGESTGKTQLARALARHFHAPMAEEFVRGYAARRHGPLEFGDHGPIARGQMAVEDAAIAAADVVVILDTDLVSTVVYCEHYFGRCPPWIQDAAKSRMADLYLLLTPDIPWVADGVRDRGGPRDEMHALFRAALDAMGARVVEIGGIGDPRPAAAIAAVENMLTR
jgi:NadR type nicotinamide-nucleotide adenylyltransferase